MGAHICNITKKVTSLIKPEGYHPFFLFHVGSNEAEMRRLCNIKRDFMSQKDVEGIRNTESSLLSFQLETGIQEEGMDQVNDWLGGWCHVQDLGFYDLR